MKNTSSYLIKRLIWRKVKKLSVATCDNNHAAYRTSEKKFIVKLVMFQFYEELRQ